MDTQPERLRLLFPDIHGLERGKYLFGDVAKAGKAAFCIGVYPLTHDKEILSVPRTQFDVGLHDVEATLDPETVRLGWERDTMVGDRRPGVSRRAGALGLAACPPRGGPPVAGYGAGAPGRVRAGVLSARAR